MSGDASALPRAVNLADKLAQIDETWSPRVVASLNDYHVKLARLEGEFVWHSHAGTVNTGDAGGERTAPADRWMRPADATRGSRGPSSNRGRDRLRQSLAGRM